MKIGLEKELFVLKDGEPVILEGTGLPFDECGLLAEARGLPGDNPIMGVFNLKAELFRMERLARDKGLTLVDDPVRKLSRDLFLKARRRYVKGVVSHQNLYDHKEHRNSRNELTAGVHVSFTSPRTLSYTGEGGVSRTVTWHAAWDFARLFRTLDKAFASEIKTAKRHPGFYEVKEDGRIEYRSLPANVDLDKLIGVLEKYFLIN